MSGRLPEEARRVLLVAAADDSEDVGVVSGAGRALGLDPRALDAAEEAGLVLVRGTRLEFRHPLVRSAVYGAATSGERRDAHRALAAALADDPKRVDRRAWHLASSALRHDMHAIRALDEAAERAEERAGHIAAARALVRAAELSADPLARGRRLVRAASNLSLAGRNEQAVLRASQAAPLVDEPALRAELAHVLALAATRNGRPYEVVSLAVEAAREVAPIDPAKAVDVLMEASIAAWQGGELGTYLEIARLGASVVPPVEDEASAVIVRSFKGFAAMLDGDTSRGVGLLHEVVAWASAASEPLHTLWASFAATWLGDSARFGALLDRTAALARERGDVGTLTEALGLQAVRLAFEQRFDEASVAASEAVQLAHELGAENLELLPRAALAIVSAVQGRDEEARRHGEDVLARATAKGLRLRASTAVYALALVELGRARWLDALKRLDSLIEGESSALDPVVAATIPDKIEAAVRSGKHEDARAALPLFEAQAGYSGAPSAQPRLAACRALLADGAQATEHFEEALRLGADARPFDLPRIRLLYGEHLRRLRRRSDARIQLRAAIDAFERLGAEPWAERARVELRATGETARKRDPSTLSQLTPQELQVARFVATGLTNKEIAAQLFLSTRTIDSHVRNVFSKLGVSSRTQLARLPLVADDPAVAPAPA